MGYYRVFLESEESWKTLNKPKVLTYDVAGHDELKARINAIKLNDKILGENDYCVIKVVE